MSAYEGSRMQEEDERRKKFTSENQRKDEEKISLGELLLNAGYKIVEQDKELTRLRSELKNLDTIRKEEFRVLSRENAKLTSELKQEREKVKELTDELLELRKFDER